jgi:uncharacterized membrane protein
MISALFPILLLAAFAYFLPQWTRPDFFFAVTVDPVFQETADARRILRAYRTIVLGFATAAAVVLALGAGIPEAVLVQMTGFFCAIWVAHRQALPHAIAPSTTIEVDLAAPPETFPGGPVAAVLPLAALAALAWWVSRNWDRVPERLPVHWGLQGPNRWIERTPLGVYGFVAFHAAICLSVVLTAWGILHWSRRVTTKGPGAAKERRFRRLNIRLGLFVAYWLAVQAWIVMLRPEALGAWSVWAVLALIAIYFVLLVRNQRGMAPANVPGMAPARAGDRTPDSCWKLGIFYFNPRDASLFVAKRFGIGYDLNFGNPLSWVFFLGGLLVVVFIRAALK